MAALWRHLALLTSIFSGFEGFFQTLTHHWEAPTTRPLVRHPFQSPWQSQCQFLFGVRGGIRRRFHTFAKFILDHCNTLTMITSQHIVQQSCLKAVRYSGKPNSAYLSSAKESSDNGHWNSHVCLSFHFLDFTRVLSLAWKPLSTQDIDSATQMHCLFRPKHSTVFYGIQVLEQYHTFCLSGITGGFWRV